MNETTSATEKDQAARVQRLWVSNTGRVACDAHGGMYLMAATERWPRRRRHDTPLDAWEAYRTSDIPKYAPGEVEALSCEDSRCGARIGARIGAPA